MHNSKLHVKVTFTVKFCDYKLIRDNNKATKKVIDVREHHGTDTRKFKFRPRTSHEAPDGE